MSQQTLGSIVDNVRKKILDEGDDDFSDAEMIRLYNLVLLEIITLVPSAYTRIKNLLLAAGAKQEIDIASGDMRIVEIRRNMGTDGLTPGRVVRVTNLDVLTQIYPDWFTATQQAEVEDWAPILDYPEQFYVVPPNDGTQYIEILVATTPTLSVFDAGGAWESDIFPLRDHFINACIWGICYMAYDDDTDIPGNTPRSQLYYQRFVGALGLQQQGEQRTGA